MNKRNELEDFYIQHVKDEYLPDFSELPDDYRKSLKRAYERHQYDQAIKNLKKSILKPFHPIVDFIGKLLNK